MRGVSRSPPGDYGETTSYPTMAYKGKLRPKGVPFRLQVYERLGNLLIEVCESKGG